MIRRTLAAGAATSVAAALLVPWAPAANAADDSGLELAPATSSPAQAKKNGPVLDLGTGSKPQTYIVQLDQNAIPTRSIGAAKDDSTKSTASAYAKELASDQSELKGAIARITGEPAQVKFTYTQALNGLAVTLTRAEALKVSKVPGVTSVQVDRLRTIQTDVGPSWIGAPTVWEGVSNPSGEGTKGEGIVAGIIDSGLNPANPSFAATVSEEDGGDGYVIQNPRPKYYGVCDSTRAGASTNPYNATWGCNDKLIGYWDYTGKGKTYDDDGHGSHTASTTVGNQVEVTTHSNEGTPNDFTWTGTISGVAPHANLIGYDVCYPVAGGQTSCSEAAIVAAINQAIADKVDVINYSIGGSSPSSPWNDTDTTGFLNARAAGIHVAVSAGNDGPGAATVSGPADAPWLTAVGASTHNRQWQAAVQNITAPAPNAGSLPDLTGRAFSKATDGVKPLIYAGNVNNNPLCLAGGFGAQASQLAGKIVVCDRGDNGRIEKGQVVSDLGAAGMILANDAASGDSLLADPHVLPAVHLTFDDGKTLKDWMATHPGATASLSGGIRYVGDDVADIMASFSSRGPNRAVSLVSPSVSAPGVDVLAALGTDNAVEWGFESGTSMASPHTAGAFALIDAEHPDWTPAEAQSALMMTSVTDITDDDGSVADWFDMGSGRIDLTKVNEAGLLLDETQADYVAANPAEGGDVRTLNTASMADNECLDTCSWTRTFTGTSTGAGTWTVSVESMDEGLSLDTDVTSLSVTDGGTSPVSVTAEVDPAAPSDTWLFGTLVLTPPEGSDAPQAHLPIAVLPSAGNLPAAIDITTRRDAGSQLETGLEAIEIDDLQITPTGLVPEESTPLSIPLDTTNSDPFDGNGTAVKNLTVPAGATSLIARLDDPTAPDFDLYVGEGAINEDNVVCSSAKGGSAEACTVDNPEPGNYWVLVQNWEASPSGTDTVDLATAVVAGNPGNLRAEGPSGHVDSATPFDIRTFWDEPAMAAGQTWHGSLTLGTSPANRDDIGTIPVTVHRVADDVTKTADKTTAAPGDVVTYTVDVAPNVTREDLAYTITDTLPEGSTYVEGSATNGASFEDGVVSWQGVLESTYGDDGDYTITTSQQDPSCQTPFGPGYTDLSQFGIARDEGVVDGDTATYTSFADEDFGFYGKPYQGLTFSDDGFLVYGGEESYDPEVDRGWLAQQVPDVTKPNGVAALLWQDMEFRTDGPEGTGGGVTTAGLTDADDNFVAGVIEYDNMRYYGDDAGEIGQLDMEVWATAGSNDLVFAYDNVQGGLLLGGDDEVGNVTIGVENPRGTQATALVNQGDANSVLEDGLNVCATYSDPVADGASFSYQVKVNDTVGNKDLTNTVVHSVDNPGAKPASSKYTVAIKGAAQRTNVALSLNPDSILTGDTTTATATVFTTGATPATGQVQFLDGTRVAGTGTLDATGKATATLSGFTTAGTLPITAKYVGDGANAASTSAPVNLVVKTKPGSVVKLTPKIGSKMVKPVEVGTRVKLRVTVRARDIVPSGTVKITLKGAGKDKTWTKTLNAKGRTKVKLPKFARTGKVKVKVAYLGDAATKPRTKKIKFTVVDRNNVR